MKLVEPPERDWLERMSIPQERIDRERSAAKMAHSVRDMVDALSLDEYAEYVDSLNYSRQEIEEMCTVLRRDTARTEYINNETIKHLRSLKLRRIWGIR